MAPQMPSVQATGTRKRAAHQLLQRRSRTCSANRLGKLLSDFDLTALQTFTLMCLPGCPQTGKLRYDNNLNEPHAHDILRFSTLVHITLAVSATACASKDNPSPARGSAETTKPFREALTPRPDFRLKSLEQRRLSGASSHPATASAPVATTSRLRHPLSSRNSLPVRVTGIRPGMAGHAFEFQDAARRVGPDFPDMTTTLPHEDLQRQ